jgi:hypothetical protein
MPMVSSLAGEAVLEYIVFVPHTVRQRAALLRLLAALAVPALLPAQTASVSGTVVNDLTGAPIHMALVVMSTTGARPLEASVYTDNNGAFSFQPPAGKYYLWAAVNGFEHASFGAPGTDRAPAVITLHAAEARQGIQLRLKPFAAISGVVVDQDNDPVPNVTVTLLVASVERGKRTYQPRNGNSTNSRGEFRIWRVAPGRYYLAASAFNVLTGMRSEVALNEQQPDLVYVPSFYPGAARIEDATTLEVKAGAEVRGLTLHVDARPAASVSGKVELPEGLTAAPFSISFESRDPVAHGASMGMGVQPDGKFGPLRLIPGSYRAVARLRSDVPYRGVELVELQPGEQEITIRVSKGITLAGHVSLEGPGAGELTKEQVSLIAVGEMVAPLTAMVKADGSFEFSNVAAGVWDIGVQPIPKGGFIKSMMLGRQDVLTEEMSIGPETHDALEIVVSSRGGVLSGVVKQPQDPLADLTGRTRPRILLAPSGELAGVLSFFAFTAADDTGKYELAGLTPGK